MASTGFGQWYEEKKQEDGPTEGSSWFGSLGADMETLPLFNSESLQSFSFANMKQTMEAQMPKKIMGMGYQQRFQVCYIETIFYITYRSQEESCLSLLQTIFPLHRNPRWHSRGYNVLGLLWPFAYFGALFRSGLLCGHVHDCHATTKICPFLYDGFPYLYGQFWHPQGTRWTHQGLVRAGSHRIYSRLPWQHVHDTLFYIPIRRLRGIRLGPCCLGGSINRLVVVFGIILARRDDRLALSICYAGTHFKANYCGVCTIPSILHCPLH